MKVIIVGDGKVGFTLAEQLTNEEHDVTVIDRNQALLTRLSESLDVMVVCGNGASMKVQREAKAQDSDLLIAATSSDELNLLCCMVARKLGCRHTIARVRDPEYTDQIYAMRDELGLSMMINPELTAAREIFKLLQIPSFLKREVFAKGRAEIVEIEARDKSPLISRKLSELTRVLGVRVLVCAVERGTDVFIPGGDFEISELDKLYITAPAERLAQLIKVLGLKKKKIRDALIIGGSRIAFYLAKMLLEAGIHVKLIEMNETRCRELATLLPSATIINADGTDHAALTEHGLSRMDAVITLTNIDEENLLVSMFANFLDVPTVITKINRIEYNDVFREKGIGSIISPKLLCATDIVRYVRAMGNSGASAAIAMHPLVDGRVEALEFHATQSTKYLGQTLSKIPLKKGLLIACISRHGVITIPQGQDTIEADDSLVVVAPTENKLSELNDIFSV